MTPTSTEASSAAASPFATAANNALHAQADGGLDAHLSMWNDPVQSHNLRHHLVSSHNQDGEFAGVVGGLGLAECVARHTAIHTGKTHTYTFGAIRINSTVPLVVKYSDEQPRDEAGRWTAGDSPAGAQADLASDPQRLTPKANAARRAAFEAQYGKAVADEAGRLADDWYTMFPTSHLDQFLNGTMADGAEKAAWTAVERDTQAHLKDEVKGDVLNLYRGIPGSDIVNAVEAAEAAGAQSVAIPIHDSQDHVHQAVAATGQHDLAANYASRRWKRHGGDEDQADTGVVLHLRVPKTEVVFSTAHSAFTNSQAPQWNEYLVRTGGAPSIRLPLADVEVVGRATKSEFAPARGGDVVLPVVLPARLHPAEAGAPELAKGLKFDESQHQRDETGRFTDGSLSETAGDWTEQLGKPIARLRDANGGSVWVTPGGYGYDGDDHQEMLKRAGATYAQASSAGLLRLGLGGGECYTSFAKVPTPEQRTWVENAASAHDDKVYWEHVRLLDGYDVLAQGQDVASFRDYCESGGRDAKGRKYFAELFAAAVRNSDQSAVVREFAARFLPAAVKGLKYSDAQPRDEHGQWTDGGDTGGLGAIAPANIPLRPDRDIDPRVRAHFGRDMETNPLDREWATSAERDFREAAATQAKERAVVKRVLADNTPAQVDAALVGAGFGKPSSAAFRADMVRQVTERMDRRWADTACDHDEVALATQIAAAKEFGLPDELASRGQDSTRMARARSDEQLRGPLERMVLRSMYENTQEQLAKDGIKDMTLYRGLAMRPDQAPASPTAPVMTHPATSFTVAPRVAYQFARTGYATGEVRGNAALGTGDPHTEHYVLVAQVPASRILATARTGFGQMGEGEVVALGSTQASVQWEHISEADIYAAADDE